MESNMQAGDTTTGAVSKQAPLPARSWVQKTPGVCGGDACVRDTRITVWGLANYRRLGLTDARLLEVIDGVTQADLDAAWDYYSRNRDEIDQAIKDNEEP